MSKPIAKFGELALRTTPSSLEDNGNESDDANGFSTIDLNGGNTPVVPSKDIFLNSSEDVNNNNPSGYTSFGETLTKSSSIYTNMTRSTTLPPINPLQQQQQLPQLPQQLPSPKKVVTSSNSGNGLSSSTSTSIFNPNTANGSNTANTNSMLSTASEASSKLVSKTASTLEILKQWSKSTYKCTRQIVTEKLGKSSRTIDPELDLIIENLRETKRKYDQILGLARSLCSQFSNMLQTQKLLGETFADLAQKSPELIDEFTSNSETQRQIVKHGETLLNGMNFFISNLSTLCGKTMEDTLCTVRNYETARLEYDAYRYDLETLQQTPGLKTEQKLQQIAELEKEISQYKEKYERLKRDVLIKIKFLDENRIKVMKKQLILFHNAVAAYFSGNQQALEATMKQFSIKLTQPNSENNNKLQSFLENN